MAPLIGSPPTRALVFIGFMGAGKTTAASEVAKALGAQALDSDYLLEERMEHSIAEEFERNGEDAFRAREEELVCELLARVDSGSVVSLGGGSVLSARVRAALESHLTVLLDVAVEVAWERVHTLVLEGAGEGGEKARPLARDWDAFAALYEERKELYEGLADAILPAGPHLVRGGPVHDSPMAAVSALPALRALAAAMERTQSDAPGVTRLLWAAAASGEYPVLVGRGLLAAAALPDVWPLDRAVSRPFCVSDATVGELYGRRLGGLAELIAIPPGESHKTLATAELVWRELAHAGMTRADHLVALGGGVVGDLAGFCAATYQRGVPIVQVPTTLVAQVDSAYGGKTGVDLPEAKNYVGAYHQPAAVIVDPETLRTLPAAELNAGWVEVLKTALIAGGELWERVAAERPSIEEEFGGAGISSAVGGLPGMGPSSAAGGASVVRPPLMSPVEERTILDCARLKLAVVAEDERDSGRRQALNLGHTVGHAIETVTGYSRYRHGEAVGLGLLAALRLSGREDLRAQVRGLLLAHSLPITLEGAQVDEVVAAVSHDKKRLGAHTPFVLVGAPGDVKVGCQVSEDELRAAVAELL